MTICVHHSVRKEGGAALKMAKKSVRKEGYAAQKMAKYKLVKFSDQKGV